MTRAFKMSAFVAMGLLMAATTVAAQKAPAITSGGEITISTLGTGSFGVESSKFTEYRVVPKGTSIPFMNLYSTGGKVDFSLTGVNVQQADQRFLGLAKAFGMGLKFDWNQIPHDMGNNGRTIFSESAPGVWTLPDNVQLVLQNAVNAQVPTSLRTYDFYSAQLAPLFASANVVDVSGARKTGNVELNLGKRLPADVTLSYRNEAKTGYRGLGSVNFRERVSPSIEVMNPLDEITHDFGVRAARTFKAGNVYASVNRSVYNNRAETLMIDYPFQAADALVTPAAGAIPALGSLSRERFVMAPDNEATTSSAGFLFKMKRHTRISGGVALSARTQDAPFYPYTANSVLNTSAGVAASSLAALPQRSYGGKVNTTSYNIAFSTKPFEGLDIRAAYRVYDLTDKSNKWPITGDVSGANSVWSVITPSADAPYGHATANIYDTKSARFTASAAYDFKDLTVEAQLRNGKLERTSREAEKGTENGMGVTAMYHMSDWLGFRGTYDVSKRTADGHTIYGFQTDEAAFTNTRTGIDVELSPMAGLDLSVAYFRRNVDYTGRPDRVPVVSGVAVAGVSFPNTPSGLLATSFDSYTGEINYAPNDRIDLGAYYTYEKNLNTNQWSTTTTTTVGGVATYTLNNTENVLASDETGTFGLNATFQLVPDKYSFSANASRQKVDGLADMTFREAGSLYTPGRTTLIPTGQGGAQDITDWDDTEITTLSAQFNVALMKNWAMSAGYMYEKYEYLDAFNATSKLLPSSINIFMKPNDGAYNAHLMFAQLNFKF